MKNTDLFSDFSATLAKPLLEETVHPWELLPLIKDFIKKLGPTLDPEEYENRGDDVYIAKSAVIFPYSTILGPAIIGPETEVRPGAFIRGSVLVGRKCVVGNSTELKNVILFDNVQVPHYNYVGDSVFGVKAHLGAGSICSNIKSDKKNVVVHAPEGDYETGLRKMGAILGDGADVGCNTVLNPGTILMPGVRVYPVSRVRGVIPANCIYKDAEHIVLRDENH